MAEDSIDSKLSAHLFAEACRELCQCQDSESFRAVAARWSSEIGPSDVLSGLIAKLGERFDWEERAEEAERTQRALQQELDTVLETVPAAIWIADTPDANRIKGSRMAYELLRVNEGANISLTADDGTAPNHFAVYRHGRELGPDELPVQLAARTGNPVTDFDEQVVFNDGMKLELLVNAQPIRGDDGAVRGSVAVAFDITNRVRMEAEIRESESLYRFLVRLDFALRELRDPAEVLDTTLRLLTEHLGVEGSAFAVAEGDGWRPEFRFGLAEDLPDRLRKACFGEDVRPEVRSVECNFPDESGPAGSCAVLAAPFRRQDRLEAVLMVLSKGPRSWSDSEHRLVELVIERGWTHAERARTEREQARGTRRYRALAEAAATVVFTVAADGETMQVSFVREAHRNFERLKTVDRWLEFVHPDDRAATRDAWNVALANQTAFEHEFRLQDAAGRYRWQTGRAVWVSDPFDGPGEWVGACVDVHDRVSTERTLRLVNDFTARTREEMEPNEIISLSQRLLGEALQATRCAYGEPTADGRRFYGPANYCVGCEDLSRRYPLAPPESVVTMTLRSGTILLVDDVATELQGDPACPIFLENAIASVLCIPVCRDGQPVGLLGVHQDRPRSWTSDEIELVQVMADRTWSELERVRASQAVGRSEQRLRRTLEAATVGVLIRDEEGKLLYANWPLLQMLDYREADLSSGSVQWLDILAGSYAEVDARARREITRAGSCRPYECEFISREGQHIPVYIGAALMPESDGGPQLHAIFVTDLSPIKEAERELLLLNENLEKRVEERTAALEAANREMEGFTYTVAHDLRSPLRGIIASARILLDEAGENLNEDHRYLLERQSANAQHLARLLDDLLVYARISRQEVRRRWVDLSQLVREVADETAAGRGHVLRIQGRLGAVADPSLLKLVLQNLLENAYKFSPEGTPIEFGREETPQGMAFYVRDHGVGFDMRHADKLFQPFVRLVHQTDFPGTGIGLANVKRIVERHSGQVWVNAYPNKGATFWFTLPESN